MGGVGGGGGGLGRASRGGVLFFADDRTFEVCRANLCVAAPHNRWDGGIAAGTPIYVLHSCQYALYGPMLAVGPMVDTGHVFRGYRGYRDRYRKGKGGRLHNPFPNEVRVKCWVDHVMLRHCSKEAAQSYVDQVRHVAIIPPLARRAPGRAWLKREL